jgi:N-acetylmuramoyl-L-alanine amidase
MLKRVVFPVLLLALGAAGPASAAVVEGARTYRAPEYTRLVFDLDASLEHRIFTLENPHRVVVDLLNSELRGNLDSLDLGDTPIASIRSAPRNEADVRVVLDMRNKVQPRSFILNRNEQYGERLVIDLYDSEPGTTPQAVLSATQSMLDDPKRDIVIAISAGHGGEDPGAIGVNKLREKNVTLAIAREVEALINATPGYRAVMIRDGDYYVGLRQRIELAHVHNAAMYIAIHADAHTNASAQGSTIYALSQRGATSEQARRLAEKENASDLIGGIGAISLGDKDEVLRSVLLDLSMTASISTSLEIGDRVIHALGNVINMRRTDVEQAAFVELKSADIPSLLIEAGYITNKKDAKNLDSPVWRKRFAGALVEGLTTWFYDRPPRGTLIAWQKHNGVTPLRMEATYIVKRGDNLSVLAERFGVSLAALKFANDLHGNVIQVGQTLQIPGSTAPTASKFTEHTIARGETLSQIATSYAVPMARIRESNQLKSDTIRVGQVLKIPAS